MLFLSETPKKIARFPFMDQYLGVLRFVSDLLREPAMILVSVRKNYPPYIRKQYPVLPEPRPQCRRSRSGLWTNVDQRHRIFLDQIDIHIADVEGSWNGYGDDLHVP